MQKAFCLQKRKRKLPIKPTVFKYHMLSRESGSSLDLSIVFFAVSQTKNTIVAVILNKVNAVADLA